MIKLLTYRSKPFDLTIGSLAGLIIGYLLIMKPLPLFALLGLAALLMIPVYSLYVIAFSFALLNSWIPPITAIGPIDVRITDVLLAALTLRVIVFILLGKKREPVASHQSLRWLWVFFIVCTLSLIKTLWATTGLQTLDQLATFLKWASYSLFFIISPYVLTTQSRIKKLAFWLCISLIAQGLYSLFHLSTRTSGFGSTADYAISLVLLITIMYGSIQYTKKSKLFSLLLLGFGIISLMLTFTRAALFIFVLVSVVYILFSKRNKLVMFISIFSLSTVSIIAYWDTLKVRITEISTNSGSFAERIDLINITLNGVWDDLLFGKGWSAFRFWNGELYNTFQGKLYALRSSSLSEIHSGYLQILFDNGAIGLIAFGLFLFATWKMIKTVSEREWEPSIKSALVGIKYWYFGIVVWLFSNQLLPSTLTSLYFWVALGIIYACYTQKEPTSSKNEPVKKMEVV